MTPRIRLAALAALLALPTAAAHLPQIPADNARLDRAFVVEDPASPVAIYGSIGGADARYYRIDVPAGGEASVLLFVPAEAPGFLPRLAIFSPGTPEVDAPPEFVERPAGYGARLVIPAAAGPIEFEPLAPSVYRSVASVTLPAGASHYLVVYEFSGGRFGLAIGAGTTGALGDWAALPLRRGEVYEWEGEPWSARGLPVTASLLVASLALAFLWRRRERPSPYELAGAIAGALMLASAPVVALQLGTKLALAAPPADLVAIGVFVALGPVLAGALALRFALLAPERVNRRARVLLAVSGAAGFAAFAGFGAAPWLAVVAAFLPADRAPP